MKGNLLIAHGGGPTAVMNAALYGLLQECEGRAEITQALGARRGIAGVLENDIINLSLQPRHIMDALPRIPSSALGSCRRKLSVDDFEAVLSVFRAHDIRYFVYQGGNDSMDTAFRISQVARENAYEFRVVGLPKTVDNDLAWTDHCPGYGSAARFYAQATRDMDVDNEALPSPIAVLEVMGRNTGWLAAACALAQEAPDRAPHLMYVPERPFAEERFVANVRDVHRALGRALVVVSEGIVRADGTPVYMSDRAVDRDGFGHRLPGNVGKYLADLLSAQAGLRARNLKPDLWGRTCIVLQSRTDREESIALGRQAVKSLARGTSDVMLTLVRTSQKPYSFDIGSVPLEKVANVERPVPDEYLSDDGQGVTEAFKEYARPLIGDPLPTYPRLESLPPRPFASQL